MKLDDVGTCDKLASQDGVLSCASYAIKVPKPGGSPLSSCRASSPFLRGYAPIALQLCLRENAAGLWGPQGFRELFLCLLAKTEEGCSSFQEWEKRGRGALGTSA